MKQDSQELDISGSLGEPRTQDEHMPTCYMLDVSMSLGQRRAQDGHVSTCHMLMPGAQATWLQIQESMLLA